jgi:two-component system response regulator NreC
LRKDRRNLSQEKWKNQTIMRFLLVDDHKLFRAAVRLLLLRCCPAAEIVEVGSGHAAKERLDDLKPDLIIMDLHLPDGDGIEFSAQILARFPDVRVIILSADSDLSHVKRALRQGISGYLLKVSAPEELARAIGVVTAGDFYLCPEANAEVMEGYRDHLLAIKQSKKPKLSARELEVLRYVAEGLRSKEIADRLQITVKTVESYRRHLARKLCCSSAVELVRYAVREGLAKL